MILRYLSRNLCSISTFELLQSNAISPNRFKDLVIDLEKVYNSDAHRADYKNMFPFSHIFHFRT